MSLLTTPHQNSMLFKPKEMKIYSDFESKYTKRNYINGGTYGKVYKCCRKGDNETTEYAVKVQHVCFEDHSYLRTLTEAQIWNTLEHKNIVQLYECFLQNDIFYFVMELVPGDNLFDEILKKSTYTETNACLYMKQILSALAYLHVNGIIHRDVKPDNIMLYQDTQKASNSVVKLVDFGLARKLENGKDRMECAPSGAPLYLAPETIMEIALGFPVDVWSCGVILYILLYGSPPFWSEDKKNLFLAIIGSEVDFPCIDEKEPVSFLANDLIQEMLVKDQNDRITASEALDHPWIAQTKGLNLSQEHRRSALERLSKFRRSISVFELEQRFNKSMKMETGSATSDTAQNKRYLKAES